MEKNDRRDIAPLLKALSKEGKLVIGTKKVEEAVASLPEVKKGVAFLGLPTEGGIDEDGNLIEPGMGFFSGEERNCFMTYAAEGDRPPRIIGQVGKDYEVVQDSKAFGFADPLFEQGIASPIATGMTHGGARHWMLSQFNEGKFDMGKGDVLNSYLLVENTHDGSGSMRASLFLFRWACSNGMVVRDNLCSVALRHCRSVHDRLNEAKRILTMADKGVVAMQRAFRAMAKRQLNKEERAAYIATVLGIDVSGKTEMSGRAKNILADVAEILEAGAGAQAHPETKHTVFGVFNAVTEYVNHKQTVRGHDGARLPSVWFGAGANKMMKAFSEAKALVKVA